MKLGVGMTKKKKIFGVVALGLFFLGGIIDRPLLMILSACMISYLVGYLNAEAKVAEEKEKWILEHPSQEMIDAMNDFKKKHPHIFEDSSKEKNLGDEKKND